MVSCRGGVMYTSLGDIISFSAKIATIFRSVLSEFQSNLLTNELCSPSKNLQYFYPDHSSEILCMSLHPHGKIGNSLL